MLRIFLRSRIGKSSAWLTAILLGVSLTSLLYADPLPGTENLDWEGDIAARLVDQVDGFLLRELDKSVAKRSEQKLRNFTAKEEDDTLLASSRERLKHLLGIRDPRVTQAAPRETAMAVIATPAVDIRAGRGADYQVYAIRWPVLDGLEGFGLLLQPHGPREPVADVIAIPDCEVTPEQLAGLVEGVPAESQYARILAESGCRVVVPLLVNRQRGQFDWGPRPAPSITNREMLYRSAYELGRGLVAYEVQTIQSVVDWFQAHKKRPTGIVGWGEGGLIALYTSALDSRIDATVVSGYFQPRHRIWQEPIDRNVFGLLEQFGDAELAAMIAPRSLIIEAAKAPEADLPGHGGAPARLTTPRLEDVRAEVARAANYVKPLGLTSFPMLVESADGQGPAVRHETLQAFRKSLKISTERKGNAVRPSAEFATPPVASLHRVHMQQIDRYTQQVLAKSGRVRQEFLSKLDTSSEEAYRRSSEPYREFFANEVIGRYDYPLVAPRPRSRQVYETERWVGYEVVLDVFDEVFAYGILLVPKNCQPGERRPVVVCQHGLEGRPQDTVGIQGRGAYAGFAGALADRGYITFAPQNLYIGEDRFRTLQRKSYPLKKTLFSIIVPQHQQIVNWLKTLPMVDGERIAFYGLSYGGKTAMRVPALVTDYCLSICSADFNEWVDKNASTTNPRSYVWTGEYEIFEFDLGSTFNYAEMAALIAPRPFMVERGHFDGVADDWTVAWEFAKVQNVFAAQLKLPDRCEIEWFDGPHTIHGVKTFEFLDRFLR